MNIAQLKPCFLPSSISRCSPFIVTNSDQTNPILLFGSYEIPLDQFDSNEGFQNKLRSSLDLSVLGPWLSPAEFISLLEEQYSAAEEFVYGHPIWAEIRDGNKDALNAYILETRHYLAAAASRMSPSVGVGIGLSPLTLLLSRHLLEEWDHAQFFEKALEEIGCSIDLARACRPLPATLEWIHFSRHIASTGELGSAICSGFMEHSSVETEAVSSWHRLIAVEKLVPHSASNAIFAHFSTDLKHGHSDNWVKAVHLHGPVSSSVAAEQLNSVAALSEMIFRWLTALQNGCSSAMVLGMQLLRDDGQCKPVKETNIVPEVKIFDGLPVWSSAVLEAISYRAGTSAMGSDVTVGLSYGFAHCTAKLQATPSPLSLLVCDSIQQLGSAASIGQSALETNVEVGGWLRAIDGHGLWTNLVTAPSHAMVCGYLLENYHYLASATRHITPAIASCTDPKIRALLIRHLEDELTHCDMLSQKLNGYRGVGNPRLARPLPTTIAFVGFLQSLARQDWRAYVIASVFLQRSLSDTRHDQRNTNFYAAIREKSPELGELLDSMSGHDATDDDLDHDQRPLLLLNQLDAEGRLNKDAIALASMTPTLAWSFLDGINAHYQHGDGTLCQRMAWTS